MKTALLISIVFLSLNLSATKKACGPSLVQSPLSKAISLVKRQAADRAKDSLKVEDINYRLLGENNKHTIVLIHGLDSALETFGVVAEDLSKNYKVLIYDQRGHGKTPDVGSDYMSSTMASDLKMLMDNLNIKSAHILGHSMGARAAVGFASMFPAMAESVIIEDMEMFSRVSEKNLSADSIAKRFALSEKLKNDFKAKVFKDRDSLVKALEPYYGPESNSLPERRAKKHDDGSYTLMFRPWVSVSYGFQGNLEDMTPQLKSIKSPILVMAADPNMTTAISEAGKKHFKKTIPQHEWVLIKGAKHAIQWSSKDEFLATLTGFVEKSVMKKESPKTATVATPEVSGDEKSLLQKNNMLPRGSALVTSSGQLADTGITQIIHAATGAMGKSGDIFEPNLQSIKDSVKNSVILAKLGGHKSLAIPFIGGKIFLQRIGVSADTLASTIIGSAIKESNGEINIKFVAFGEADTALFKNSLSRLYPVISNQRAEVLSGSLTDYSLHQSSAIVNAANMEVVFGGGLSGVIAGATGNSEAINQEAASLINGFFVN